MVKPALADLPVYVRAGSIVPMQPLVQSTGEVPQGPLTLRVFVPAAGAPPASGEPCQGDLYQDDGHSFDFRRGAYLRLHLSCSVAADGTLTVSIPRREGSYKPWWTQLRIEAVGLAKAPASASANGRSSTLERTALGWATTLNDSGVAQTVVLR
jgi:alpha-glucosidase